jgi:hypothetical protein
VQFPVLAGVVGYVPEVIKSINAVISSGRARWSRRNPNNFFYSQNGRLLRSPDLHSALFNSLDLQEQLPAPEMEDLCQTPLANPRVVHFDLAGLFSEDARDYEPERMAYDNVSALCHYWQTHTTERDRGRRAGHPTRWHPRNTAWTW